MGKAKRLKALRPVYTDVPTPSKKTTTPELEQAIINELSGGSNNG